MYISRIIALATLAIPGLALAQEAFPTSEEGFEKDLRYITNDTTFASPTNENIESAIATLKIGDPYKCQQKNRFGSYCTTIIMVGDAALGLCEHPPLLGNMRFLACPEYADYAQYLYQNVQNGFGPSGKAGGNFTSTDGKTAIIIFNSEDSRMVMAQDAALEAEAAAIEGSLTG